MGRGPGTIDGRRLRLRRPSSQTLRVIAIAGLMLALGLSTGAPFFHRGPYLPHPTLPWWAIAAAFAATEACVLHIQVKREARTVSLSELPLVLALFFTTPLQLLTGRLLGSTLVFIGQRRSSPLKTLFNLALIIAQTSVAVATFAGITAWAADGQLLSWLAAYAAAFLANILGDIAIGVVIAVYDGGLRWRPMLHEALTGQPVAPMVVTVALVAVNALSASLQSAWLLVLLGALILLAYRAYASLSDRHLNLERLYRFSQAVSNAPELDQVLTSVLGEAKELLRSERASVAFLSEDGDLVARVRLGASDRLSRSEEPPGPEDAWLLHQVMNRAAPLLMPRGTRDPLARRLLDRHDMREAVAVPLRGTTGTIGVLTVADRMGDVRTYDDGDVLLLETVANHASTALQNGELLSKLRHDALHDALTGLPNRTDLNRRMAAALEDVEAGRAPGAVAMILDLDEFKQVNDTLGHDQGDRLLIEVAARLTSAIGVAGTVARLGGDEFAILMPGTADEDRAMHVGRRLLRALEQPIALDGLEVEVGASVGVALAPAHASEPAALLKRADVAMYDAKTSTRRLRIYDADLDTDNPRRLTLVSELRAALQNGDVQVHVQPQAQLPSGAVVSVEALVRWEHPELGQVAPDEFIPVAERSGLIGPLTTRVLDASLAACAGWRAAGWDLGIAVNLSTRSLHDADLVEEVGHLLRRHHVPAHRLTLEVTESSVMADPARAVSLLHQLRDLGVRLSVDDFGTGYSSLSYLKRLPVQEVKIDRSFVAGIREEGDDVAIVRAIIDLGRNLGLEVVAEGVEDEATQQLLTRMGCDLVQGWHLARPMPTAELTTWLRSRAATGAERRGLRAV